MIILVVDCSTIVLIPIVDYDLARRCLKALVILLGTQLTQVRCPVVLIHGVDDTVVPCTHVDALLEAAKQDGRNPLVHKVVHQGLEHSDYSLERHVIPSLELHFKSDASPLELVRLQGSRETREAVSLVMPRGHSRSRPPRPPRRAAMSALSLVPAPTSYSQSCSHTWRQLCNHREPCR